MLDARAEVALGEAGPRDRHAAGGQQRGQGVRVLREALGATRAAAVIRPPSPSTGSGRTGLDSLCSLLFKT